MKSVNKRYRSAGGYWASRGDNTLSATVSVHDKVDSQHIIHGACNDNVKVWRRLVIFSIKLFSG